MSMTFQTYVQRLFDESAAIKSDFNPQILVPGAIDYGEQRCYRDLDLLNTVTRQTGTLTSGSRDFTLPSASGRFVVTNGINVITPSSQATPNLGTRVQLESVSRDYMDAVWPSTAGTGTPSCYAMVTDQTIIVGPVPNAGFTVEVIGTIRPTPLSSSNTTTYLTLYLPDLFLAASMIYLANLAEKAAVPAWEQQYATRLASANVEENRKKYASGAWGSLQPTPIATPGR